jgi:hypothetical protein
MHEEVIGLPQQHLPFHGKVWLTAQQAATWLSQKWVFNILE